MLAKVAYDEHYNDIAKMMDDLGKLLRHNFKCWSTPAAGTSRSTSRCSRCPTMARCRRPSMRSTWRSRTFRTTFTYRRISARAITPSARNMTVRSAIAISTSAATRRTSSARSNALPYLIEHDMTPHYEGSLGDKQIGVGAVDVQDPQGRERRNGRRAHTGARMACARTDHRHELMWIQSSVPARRLGQAEGHGGGKTHAWRMRQCRESASGRSTHKLRGRVAGRWPGWQRCRKAKNCWSSPRRRGGSACSSGRCRRGRCGFRRNSSRFTD